MSCNTTKVVLCVGMFSLFGAGTLAFSNPAEASRVARIAHKGMTMTIFQSRSLKGTSYKTIAMSTPKKAVTKWGIPKGKCPIQSTSIKKGGHRTAAYRCASYCMKASQCKGFKYLGQRSKSTTHHIGKCTLFSRTGFMGPGFQFRRFVGYKMKLRAAWKHCPMPAKIRPGKRSLRFKRTARLFGKKRRFKRLMLRKSTTPPKKGFDFNLSFLAISTSVPKRGERPYRTLRNAEPGSCMLTCYRQSSCKAFYFSGKSNARPMTGRGRCQLYKRAVTQRARLKHSAPVVYGVRSPNYRKTVLKIRRIQRIQLFPSRKIVAPISRALRKTYSYGPLDCAGKCMRDHSCFTFQYMGSSLRKYSRCYTYGKTTSKAYPRMKRQKGYTAGRIYINRSLKNTIKAH